MCIALQSKSSKANDKDISHILNFEDFLERFQEKYVSIECKIFSCRILMTQSCLRKSLGKPIVYTLREILCSTA